MKMVKKRIVATLFALTLACGAFALTGCREKFTHPEEKLQIYLYNAGYGYKWCEDILAAFKEEAWVKEKYPNMKVTFEKDELATRARELLGAPKKVNKYEIVLSTSLENSLGPDAPVVDLTDEVYNSEVPGEGVLYKDKMIQSYLNSAAYNGKGASADAKRYYQINWASGMTGMIYNEDKLAALGFDVPNTTDELVQIMADVKALNGSHPSYPVDKAQSDAIKQTSYATYGSSAYANYLYWTWWAQYQTAEEYANFFNGVDSETNTLSSAIFSQTGLLRTLEVLESYMHKDTG